MNLVTLKSKAADTDVGTACELRAESSLFDDSVLDSVVSGRRDYIVASRSYGMVHILSEMMRKSGLSRKKLFGSDDEDAGRIHSFLPCFMSVLLDPESTPRSSLRRMQSQSFFPEDMPLTARSIRELLEALLFYPPLRDFRDLDPVETVDDFRNIHDLNRENPELQQQKMLEKIKSWLKSDDNNWSSGLHLDGLMRLVAIASRLRALIEQQTGMSWNAIYDHMFSLNAVDIEHGAQDFMIATRATTKQLTIFHRLEITQPESVIDSNSFVLHDQQSDESVPFEDHYGRLEGLL